MAAKKDKDPKGWINYIGLAILLVCYLGALWNVFQVKKDEMILGKKVIRIAHWQLELGITDALNRMAELYEKQYIKDKVKQGTEAVKKIAEALQKTEKVGKSTAVQQLKTAQNDMKAAAEAIIKASERNEHLDNHPMVNKAQNSLKKALAEIESGQKLSESLSEAKSAVEEAIASIKKLKEIQSVKVIQLPVPERAYGQWTITQLIGRTAPDLIELGFFDVKSYLGRFFVPITAEVCAPNPYNADNKFKDTPWKETFNDGLQNCYYSELMDYYAVGLSQFTVRLFYNKTLFKRILHTEEPPKDLVQLIEYCDKIQTYVKKRNEAINEYNKKHSPKKSKIVIYPISSSKYQVGLFRYRFASAMTADRCLDLDTNYDGGISDQERLAAILKGELTFEDEKYKASMEVVKDLSKYFNPGFMSTGREDAGFAFVQGRATIITSGSWDASSYIKKINDQPFGDIILEVAGKKVSSTKEATAALMEVAKDKKRVEIKIDREGATKNIKITPIKGKDIWQAYGFNLENVAYQGKQVPVVIEIDSSCPASEAGLRRRKRFDVGFLDFPLPTINDPKYGKMVVGRVAESDDTGFKFGLVKFSKHKKEAIGFLQFCTTPKNNEELNKIASWLPAVKEAEPVDYLKAFKPNFRGFWDYLHMNTGKRVKMLEGQLYWPYISGETSFDEYIAQLKENMPHEAAIAYADQVRKINEQVPDKHLRRSIFLAKTMFAETPEAKADATQKFKASWDTVIAFERLEPELNAVMKPCFKDKEKTQFSKDFFESYVPPEKH